MSPESIARAYGSIRPFVRQTPTIAIHGEDCGLAPIEIVFKLELLQHSGSFKVRGAFANMLLRKVPQAGVAVGGGGLLAGVASRYHGRVRLIGVEPETAPTLTTALAKGRPADAIAGGIAADSLAPKRVGDLTFPIARQLVDRVVLVRDEDIQAAQHMLWDRLRIITEPGGAAAFAALLSGRYQPDPRERTGVILCGGNLAIELTAPCIASGAAL